MKIPFGIATILTLAATALCSAHAAGPGVFAPTPQLAEQHDTLDTHITESSQRFYDSIEAKANRRTVPRLLYDMVFVQQAIDTLPKGSVLDESRLLEPYAGKIINQITFERTDLFDKDGNWLERAGNKLHMVTREKVIRRDLLFKVGDAIDPQTLVRNQHLLRSRPYISDADFIIRPDSLDTTRVNLIIRTRDSWTISIDAGLRSEGRTMVGLSDNNILGTGNRLKFITNFNRKEFTYGGNMVEYSIPNVLGSFLMFDFAAGRDFRDETLRIGLRKEFIRPTDYEVGITYSDLRFNRYMINRDTSVMVKTRNLDLWGGRSRYIRGIRSSAYLTLRYNYARFSERPFTAPGYNPSLQDHDALLIGAGMYREKFYTTNMVYGFGIREYLATGYRAELVTGYTWGEFGNEMYLGLGYKTGGFSKLGYLMGGFTMGSYINMTTGKWSRSAIDVDFRWFSSLFTFRRNRIRQLLAVHYTQGWNRERGSDEIIRFTPNNGIRAYNKYAAGTNRLAINTETVLFSPWQLLGFRFAFFGFLDAGLIGYSPNIFKNEFFSSVGLGVRIKNERLIFSTIQIHMGFAFSKRGLAESEYFNTSNSTRLEEYRYRPTRPEIVGFE